MADAATWFGARAHADGVDFRVWAPHRKRVEVVIESGAANGTRQPLRQDRAGCFAGAVAAARAGDLYRYRVDGKGPFPDPASRFQPSGVHGPSEVVDASAFAWSDADWKGLERRHLVLYELHVGTFSKAGTFAAVRERLPYLRDLGVTAIELMPVADFPGERNWGYDGVDLFAPAHCYGRPDDLRALVDTAHALGLGVLLDVVYNHFGPDGNYMGVFSPELFTNRHHTPWGAAINLDGPHSDEVRAFFIANALHWLGEYHCDGLRLDATHALVDDGPRHFLAELAQKVEESSGGRALLIAEDHRNLATIVRARRAGGWGLDAVWADDFHHQMRRRLAGDDEGYFRDFSGSTADLATTLRQGWFYRGQYSPSFDAPRGTDPSGLEPWRFVICLQNHDQIGNRAFGERLHHQIDAAAYRAATALLLLAPQVPLLFMGQEWGASSPFLYFTDHEPDLGAKVTAGRRREFRHFAAFRDAATRSRIPDPQSRDTFRASRLRWEERDEPAHAALSRLHRALLQLRGELAAASAGEPRVDAVDDETLALWGRRAGGAHLLVVVRLGAPGSTSVTPPGPPLDWRVLLSSEEPAFALDPAPVGFAAEARKLVLTFARAGAIVLEATPPPR